MRPEGLAFSSGLAWLIGWPGGAKGFLMPSKTGRASFLAFLFGELFLGISSDPSGEITQLPKVSGMLPPPGASVNILQTPHGEVEYRRLIALDLAAR